MSPDKLKTYRPKIAVVGGGIAGLWIYCLLKHSGYQSCVLLEKNGLGGTQSLASQGMIHGGQRYSLQGKQNQHSEGIAQMPEHWDRCLRGEAFPDLSAATVLANNQYMWSPGGLTSNVTSFFASKAMNSRVDALDKKQWPPIFQDYPNFKGKIYQLTEKCLDIKSVILALKNLYPEDIYAIRESEYESADGNLTSIQITDDESISADQYIFAAGSGNEEIAQLLAPEQKITQRRPLKQILVRELDYSLYAHCITVDPRPRVTVSAHPLENGKYVWYLGGLVAVKALETTEDKAIAFAQSEMAKLFPQIDWQTKDWSTLSVDRAEPYTKTGFLPEGSVSKELGNCLLVWPTKLTFAPQVAASSLEIISHKGLKSEQRLALPLRNAQLAQYPWLEQAAPND